MKMCDIYMGLEKELAEIEPAYLEAEKKYNYHLAEAEKAEQEMNKFKINVMSLKKAMAALEEGDFGPSEEERKQEEKERKKKEELEHTKVKPPKDWVRHKGHVGQFNPQGELINKFSSQRDAGRITGIGNTYISKLMRSGNRESQIRRYGFYFDWID